MLVNQPLVHTGENTNVNQTTNQILVATRKTMVDTQSNRSGPAPPETKSAARRTARPMPRGAESEARQGGHCPPRGCGQPVVEKAYLMKSLDLIHISRETHQCWQSS